MEEFFDRDTLAPLTVSYTDDERRAVILAIHIYREELLSKETSYDDLESLQQLTAITMELEDEVERGGHVSADVHAYIKQYYLPMLLKAAQKAREVGEEFACERYHTNPEELHTSGAEAKRMLDNTRQRNMAFIAFENSDLE